MHPRFLSIVVLLVAGMTAFSSSPALAKAPTSTSSPEELRAYLVKLEEQKATLPEFDYLMSKAQTLEDLGRYADAVPLVSRAIKLHPKNSLCIEIRCRLNERLKRWHDTAADKTRLIEMGVDVSRNLALRGIDKVRMHDFKGGLEDAEAAIKVNARDDDAWFCKGDAQQELGDHAGAIDSFSRAIEINPKNWTNYHCRALSHKALNEIEKARLDIQRARVNGWKEPKLSWE